MFQNVFSNWNFIRGIRLVLGIMLVAQSVALHNWGMAMFGGLFIFQSITNTGCCGSGGCNVYPNSKKTDNANHKLSEVEYEEVR
jgi:hypothetical protein